MSGVGGLVLLDAVHDAEGPTFIGFLASLLLAALANTLGARIRDVLLPVTEALAAAGGALLAIALGLGFTDERYMKAPSTGQLLLAVSILTAALVSARVQIAREDREKERRLIGRLERIEQAQDKILNHLIGGRRTRTASRANVRPSRVRGRARRR